MKTSAWGNISLSSRWRKYDFICAGIGQFSKHVILLYGTNDRKFAESKFIRHAVVCMKFGLSQGDFYFTEYFYFLFAEMADVLIWFSSMYLTMLSARYAEMAPVQFARRHSFLFPFDKGPCIIPRFWSPVHKTTANSCPEGSPLKHRRHGSNDRHRWQRQNETKVEELNSAKETASNAWNFTEDLGPLSLCCITTENCSFCETGNPFISVRKID